MILYFLHLFGCMYIVPPGDESWLCPGCDCKADCIDMIKDVHATKISIIDSWEV